MHRPIQYRHIPPLNRFSKLPIQSFTFNNDTVNVEFSFFPKYSLRQAG